MTRVRVKTTRRMKRLKNAGKIRGTQYILPSGKRNTLNQPGRGGSILAKIGKFGHEIKKKIIKKVKNELGKPKTRKFLEKKAKNIINSLGENTDETSFKKRKRCKCRQTIGNTVNV